MAPFWECFEASTQASPQTTGNKAAAASGRHFTTARTIFKAELHVAGSRRRSPNTGGPLRHHQASSARSRALHIVAHAAPPIAPLIRKMSGNVTQHVNGQNGPTIQSNLVLRTAPPGMGAGLPLTFFQRSTAM